MEELLKMCPECGREIIGRSDKKFCTDACRSAYNNKSLAGVDNFIRKVNRTLKRNRSILKELNPNGKTTLHRDRLIKAGLNFDYFTSIYVTKDNREYRFCYEQGYLTLEDGFMLLVSRETED